jgi:hypothetical protein
VLLSGASVVVALMGGEKTTSEATSPLVPPPDAQPTEAPVSPPVPASGVDQLRALIPPELTNCPVERTEGLLYPEATGAIACDSPDQRVKAIFHLFPTEDASSAAYQQEMADLGIQPDTADCASSVEGEEGWSGGGGQGRLICSLLNAQVLIDPATGEVTSDQGVVTTGYSVLWTSEGFSILGQLVAVVEVTGVQDVYEIWQGISDYPR